MAPTLDSLSDDILLLFMSEAYLPWYSVLTLATVNRRLRDLNPYQTKSEDDWRLLLYRHGMGRSEVDARAGHSWADLAKGMAQHCLGCETCYRVLARAPKDVSDAKVLSRQEARAHPNMKMAIELQAIRIFGHDQHYERARLSPDWVSKASAGASNGHRLDQHPPVGSMFAMNKPVSFVYYSYQDYVYYREQPPRKDLRTSSNSVRNDSGITVLDVMLAVTDWQNPKSFAEGELVRFGGVKWDSVEWITLPDGSAQTVEMVARYDDPM